MSRWLPPFTIDLAIVEHRECPEHDSEYSGGNDEKNHGVAVSVGGSLGVGGSVDVARGVGVSVGVSLGIGVPVVVFVGVKTRVTSRVTSRVISRVTSRVTIEPGNIVTIIQGVYVG